MIGAISLGGARWRKLAAKVKTGNPVAGIERLEDSLERWDELFIQPAPPDMKPVFTILRGRVRERLEELEVEVASKN